MPELPEVETVKRGLRKYLIGHTINKVEINLPKMLTGEINDIVNTRITEVNRFGKGLVIELVNGYAIAIHIKMTGQLIYRGPNLKKVMTSGKVKSLPNKFTHAIFYLDKEAILYYNDMRQFGWIKIIATKDITEIPFFSSLGPEPLKDLTYSKFAHIISKSRSAIKTVLMDQKKIGGIGNIYANDALFKAKIHPLYVAADLNFSERKRLFNAIEAVLRKGIREGGASEISFVNAEGKEGSYQKHFLIYRRKGKPCYVCNTIILKMQISGRGTFYCPRCQKDPKIEKNV